MRRRWLGLLGAGSFMATAVLARTVVAEPLRVASESMAPTLRRGDEVLVRKFGLGDLRRGDLVTFVSPEDGRLALKRVVGLPGDTVAVEDGVLRVNDRSVPESYVDLRTVDGVYYGPVRVPAGRLLLLGDNRERSIDSRSYGPVAWARVRGKVVTRIW